MLKLFMAYFKIYCFVFLSVFLLNNSLIIGAIAIERPHEELMVVQTVSKNRRSFVVTKGVKDGVVRGQEVIFANDNISIVCKALEVNRNYSLWTPVDKNANIPFNKDDFISYNSHAYGNVALDIVTGAEAILPERDSSDEFKKFRIDNSFSLKASFEQGLSQSSSDVSADKNSKRSGYTFALDYNYRFMPEFEMSFGARIDEEVYRISTPQLDIPTSRMMATAALTYHFIGLSKDKNNFYLTLAAGIGKSTTTVNDEKNSGLVTLLPEVRVGDIIPFSKSMAIFLEGSIESLSAHETLQNQTEQVTNTMNAKFTIGLRF